VGTGLWQDAGVQYVKAGCTYAVYNNNWSLKGYISTDHIVFVAFVILMVDNIRTIRMEEADIKMLLPTYHITRHHIPEGHSFHNARLTREWSDPTYRNLP
jgi:hypothetical protein